MKYFIAIIIILLIILYFMGCVIVKKDIDIYVIKPNVNIEAEIK